MGKPGEPLNTYRPKRNLIDYDASEVATETEELLEKPEEFQEMVKEWLGRRHPIFKA